MRLWSLFVAAALVGGCGGRVDTPPVPGEDGWSAVTPDFAPFWADVPLAWRDIPGEAGQEPPVWDVLDPDWSLPDEDRPRLDAPSGTRLDLAGQDAFEPDDLPLFDIASREDRPLSQTDRAGPSEDLAVVEGPSVTILSPLDGAEVPNPVTFTYEASEGVATVAFFADEWPLQDDVLPASQGTHTYLFNGVNRERLIILEGYDSGGSLAATDEIVIIPTSGLIPGQSGFNDYVVEAINDWDSYPKDSTYPYCWTACPGSMGMVHGVYYMDDMLWQGEGSCFCTGHTLEILFDAYDRWQQDNNIDSSVPYGGLTWDSAHGGDFYQHWQGYGVASVASSANALESAGIGANIYEENWEEALAGDFANISRSTGSGHSIIFIDWIREGLEITGIRYYGCNSGGDSTPDPLDPAVTHGNSGPSFVTEMFEGHGGTVLPEYVFLGRPFDPGDL